MSSQAAKSPPIQKGQAGHWKRQTRQKTRPLIGSQISAFFFFLKMKLKCSMHPLNLTLEHLARSFYVTWQKSEVQPCKMTICSVFQCICVAVSVNARILSTLLLLPPPANNHRGSDEASPGRQLLGKTCRPHKLQVLVKWCDCSHHVESPKLWCQQGRSVLKC